jgi:hypothetical protein
MSTMRRFLLTIAVGLVIVALATGAGIALNGVRLSGPDESGAPGTQSTAQGLPYRGAPDDEAALVAAEEDRLDAVKSVAASVPWETGVAGPYRVPTSPAPTLVLTARAEPYTLAELQTLAPQTFTEQADGSYLLSEHLVVLSGATLDLTSNAPSTVRLLSSRDAFVSIVSLGGGMTLQGSADGAAAFASFDPATSAPDTTTADGRAYIRAIGGGVDIRNAAFSDLGFWSGATGGLSLTGADRAGIPSVDGEAGSEIGGAPTLSEGEFSALTETEHADPGAVTGAIADVSMSGNAFGLFVSTASELSISGTRIEDSLIDGVVLHRGVTDSAIESVESSGNARDGIVVERSSSGIAMSGVTASGNGRNGISIDGRALVEGPSASGTPVVEYGDVRVSDGTVSGNARYGIEVTGGHTVAIAGSDIRANMVGIAVGHGATDVQITDNVLTDEERQAISISGGVEGTEVRGNRIESVDTGVRIRAASAIVDGNTFTDISNHAVTLVGDAKGVRVTGNTVAGHGSTAFYDDATGGFFARNDVEGWERPVTVDSVLQTTLAQPLTLVWVSLGLLLVVTAVTGHRRRGTKDPYLEQRPLTELSRGIVPVEELRGEKP